MQPEILTHIIFIMSSATIHYKLTFKGYHDYKFSFVVHKGYDIDFFSDLDDYVYVEDDGYLYIQGRKITNNSDGIRAIRISLATGGDYRDGYKDIVYSIDDKGYVIVLSNQFSFNNVERFLNKIFG